MVTAAEKQRVGTLIKKRRQELGIRTQAALAALVGTSETSVAKWESGKHYPGRNLGKLEAVLKLDLTGDEDPQVLEIRAMDWLEPDEKDAWIALYRRRRPVPAVAPERIG